MPAVLANTASTLYPTALSEYSSEQDGGSIRHEILGRVDPDVTFRPLMLRTGSFTVDFTTDALASDARKALSVAGAWTLAHSERASVNMRFIVRRLSRVIDGGNGRWSLNVSYEEIGA